MFHFVDFHWFVSSSCLTERRKVKSPLLIQYACNCVSVGETQLEQAAMSKHC